MRRVIALLVATVVLALLSATAMATAASASVVMDDTASSATSGFTPAVVGQCYWQNSGGLDYCWYHWFSDSSSWEAYHLYTYYAGQFLNQGVGQMYYYPYAKWYAYCVSSGGIMYLNTWSC